MGKLDKYRIQNTISGEISIVELENKQEFEGLSMLKAKSGDKSSEAILAVMSHLKSKLDSGNSITVSSSIGKLTFELKEE